MTEIKIKAIQLIERLPDDKVVHIVNIMQEFDILFNGSLALAKEQGNNGETDSLQGED